LKSNSSLAVREDHTYNILKVFSPQINNANKTAGERKIMQFSTANKRKTANATTPILHGTTGDKGAEKILDKRRNGNFRKVAFSLFS